LVFLMDMNCVLCEVGTSVLYSLDECHSCGCTIAQVVSCQCLAMEALVLFQPLHMRVVINKVPLGHVFLQELKVLPVTNIIPLVLHSSSSSYCSHQKDKQAETGNFQTKQCSSRYWGALYYSHKKDKQAEPGNFRTKQCCSRYWGALYYCHQKDTQAERGNFQRKQCSPRYWEALDRNMPSLQSLKTQPVEIKHGREHWIVKF
jgi:hypothetical protein